ncbi:hypothetical protein CEK25_008046 [Fusarium fujikuroi]|nr:hypothetical protein CEK25_008046 [Fusarium fujikuroi]
MGLNVPKFLIIKYTIAFNIVTTIIVTICGLHCSDSIAWDIGKSIRLAGCGTLNIPAIIFFHAGCQHYPPLDITLDVPAIVTVDAVVFFGLQPKKFALRPALCCIRIPILTNLTLTANTTCTYSRFAQGFVSMVQ